MTTQHSSLTGSQLHEMKGAAAASSGQVPIADGSGSTNFTDPPWLTAITASTDNAIARFDGSAGTLQDSGITIDDSDNLTSTGNASFAGTITEGGELLSDKYAAKEVFVFKTADTTITNTATLADASGLASFNLDASTSYLIRGIINWNSDDGATGIKLGFSLESGSLSASKIHVLDLQPDSSDMTLDDGAITDTYTIAMGSPGGTGNAQVQINGFITVNNAASLRLQWAQDVAATINTTFRDGSFIELHT